MPSKKNKLNKAWDIIEETELVELYARPWQEE